jgi:hypothetical protein
MKPLIQLRTTISPIVIAFVLACFAMHPGSKALGLVPSPDGGYPKFTTAEGQNALLSLTTGAGNTGLGWFSLKSVTTGSFNTGVGAGTLVLNTGDENTAIGTAALLLNTSGTQNTAVGVSALLNNTEGNSNAALGYQALLNNTGVSGSPLGSRNTAIGDSALLSNTTGFVNTAIGYSALLSNVDGVGNNAFGALALFGNQSGEENNAFGEAALANNTTASGNSAFGNAALVDCTGFENTAIGQHAGDFLTTGSGNVYIGANVHGVAGDNDTTRIRNIYSSMASARAVFVNQDDKIGTLSSSRRFKEEIRPMNNASETLFALKPVTFRYKKEIDPVSMLSFGLIAEEVAEINPELITRDKEGKPETVRYEAINAMFLNEFLKSIAKTRSSKRSSCS